MSTKTYAIKNISTTDVGAGGFVWHPGETKNLRKSLLNDDIIALTDAGTKLYCAEDLSPLGGLASLTNPMATGYTYNGGGTATARVDGALTIPAITGDASAQNAFATIFAELNHARAAISSLSAQVEALKSNSVK